MVIKRNDRRNFDKFILLSFKFLYLFLRLILTVVLGKRRRNNLYYQKEISFNSFLYAAIKKFVLYKYTLLKNKVPKYDYMFFCRENNED